LWQGYLLPGALTLLTSQWKTGKTTLVSVLLARRRTGGPLAGLPLTAGRSVVVTEESPDHWRRRTRHLDFGNHVGWFCRPFRGRPTPDRWASLVDEVAALGGRHGVDLVVIDPLAPFMAGGSENDAGCMLETLMPLQRLTSAGMSVLVLHHPRRIKAAAGQTARGSGALTGFADILIEMHGFRAPGQDRRRRLEAFSRYPETPRELVIEWTANGSDYLGQGAAREAEFAGHWRALRTILEQAFAPLSRRELRRSWPGQRPEPEKLAGMLEWAVEQGQVRKAGAGVKANPYRYWLPDREAEMRQDPLVCLLMPEWQGRHEIPENSLGSDPRDG
jgi:hypothetical protein